MCRIELKSRMLVGTFIVITSGNMQTKCTYGVDKEKLISGLQIVDDRGFRKIGHVGHIFKEFVFWRILWFDIFFLFSGIKEPSDGPIYHMTWYR